jgi:hypothetical protein
LKAKISLLAALIAIGHSLLSQSLLLKGRVISAETAEALAYAQITVNNRSIGTLSQVNGSFTFHIPQELANDTLIVTHLGFKTLTYSIHELLKNPQQLELRMIPQSISLQPITVTDRKLTPIEMLKEAVSRISSNYAQGPYLLKGFFRDWKMVDHDHAAGDQSLLIEAAVNIIGRKKSKSTDHDVYLRAFRKTQLPEKHWHYFNSLEDLLERNYVLNLGIADFYDLEPVLKLPNNYQYTFKEALSAGDLVCIEASLAGENTVYRIFVHQLSYAIERIDLLNTRSFARGSWDILSIRNTFRYREYNGKWFLSYCRRNWRIENYDRQADQLLRTEEYYVELLINEIQIDEAVRGVEGVKMVKNRPLEFQTHPYDSVFWNTYNVIENDSLAMKIRLFAEQSSR